jgi:hypothetical protein
MEIILNDINEMHLFGENITNLGKTIILNNLKYKLCKISIVGYWTPGTDQPRVPSQWTDGNNFLIYI